jgi:hypothetical protein
MQRTFVSALMRRHASTMPSTSGSVSALRVFGSLSVTTTMPSPFSSYSTASDMKARSQSQGRV